MKVPFLRESDIERDVEVLLAQYAAAPGMTLTLPIPVEQILEQHLQLTLEFDDLHRRFQIPLENDERDLLGALWVPDREVIVDESLDPDGAGAHEGRYRFTLGHEIGHWQLHRDYLTQTPEQPSLFETVRKPTVICRSSESSRPIEWQANMFAANLLMPRNLMTEAWRGYFGDVRARVIRDDARAWDVSRSLAERFKVSTRAMSIRLESLGLLFRGTPAQPFLVLAS